MNEREQVWRNRIEWQRWSGLTVAECCKEAGVSVASFYRWKKLLTAPQGARGQRPARRSEPPAVVRRKQTSQFIPIAVRDASASHSPLRRMVPDPGSSLRLELPNGVVIHVADNLDGQRLGDVIVAAGQIRSGRADMTTHGLPPQEVPSC